MQASKECLMKVLKDLDGHLERYGGGGKTFLVGADWHLIDFCWRQLLVELLRGSAATRGQLERLLDPGLHQREVAQSRRNKRRRRGLSRLHGELEDCLGKECLSEEEEAVCEYLHLGGVKVGVWDNFEILNKKSVGGCGYSVLTLVCLTL